MDETAGQAIITVSRTGTTGPNTNGTGNITVQFATTTNGTAVAGVNYSPTNCVLSFPPGEVMETAVVPVMDDGVVTTNLTVTVVLATDSTTTAALGVQPSAVLTIINDDSAMSFSNAIYSVNENTVPLPRLMSFVLVRPMAPVRWISSPPPTARRWPEWILFRPIRPLPSIRVLGQAGPGSDHQHRQVGKSNGYVLAIQRGEYGPVSPSNATLIIQNLANVPGQLCFSAINYVANEGDGNAYITVLRTNGNAASVSVTCTTVAGTALPM